MRFLDKYFSEDKRLLRLDRERRRLWQAQREAPVIPLERPYQRGWTKSYILTAAVRRRPDVAVFAAILRAVNQRVYARTRAFVDRRGKPIVLRPRIIEAREWLRLRWPASHQRYFSYGCWRFDSRPWHPSYQRSCISGFKLFHDWWLTEDTQPNLITHQRVALPKVEARLAEIEAYLRNTCGSYRLNNLQGRRARWRYTNTWVEERSTEALNYELNDVARD